MLGLALLLLAAPARPVPAAGDLAVRRALDAASVVIETTGCAGAVAENPQIIVTAKHCLEGRTLRVRLSTGALRTAWLVATNDSSDQAVLFLEEPAGVEPLELVRRRQIPGTVLYFEGNPGRPRFQSARLDRVGRCPSLPNLPDALFTSIAGVPGDSGAPLVDAAARIVGLVHGGARCHIATPADALAKLVDRALDREVVEMTRTPAPPIDDEKCSRPRRGPAVRRPPPAAAYGERDAGTRRAAPLRPGRHARKYTRRPPGRSEAERRVPAPRSPSRDAALRPARPPRSCRGAASLRTAPRA